MVTDRFRFEAVKKSIRCERNNSADLEPVASYLGRSIAHRCFVAMVLVAAAAVAAVVAVVAAVAAGKCTVCSPTTWRATGDVF